MSKDRVLEKKLAQLYSQRNAGIKFGLDVVRRLMAELGNPQDKYAVIHIAGTNGKGSVCSLVSSVLGEAGLRTGLYISPHLVEFNERMTVNGVKVTDAELLQLAGFVDGVIPVVREECGREPTFFEYATAMAFKFFEMKNVQVAVLETGMGGRLDATNIIVPLVSVITRISLEHTEFLGNDIASIAGEKAGIIKAGRPVVCGAMPEEARAVVRKRAAAERCLFRDVEGTVAAHLAGMSFAGNEVDIETDDLSYGRIKSRLVGLHQVENLATAVAVVEEAQRSMGLDVGVECMKAGLAKAEWTGRFQVLSMDPPVVLDGGHNPGAAEVLADTIRKLFPHKPVGMVLGMCGDKDLDAFLKSFRGVRRVWAVTIRNERAVPAVELAERVNRHGFACEPMALPDALEAASEWASRESGIVCIAGSLFLAGEVLELKEEL